MIGIIQSRLDFANKRFNDEILESESFKKFVLSDNIIFIKLVLANSNFCIIKEDGNRYSCINDEYKFDELKDKYFENNANGSILLLFNASGEIIDKISGCVLSELEVVRTMEDKMK